MNLFRATCTAAVLGLLTISAFSQEELNKGKKGGGGGGSPVQQNGGGRGGDQKGGGPIQSGGGERGSRGGPVQTGGGNPIQGGPGRNDVDKGRGGQQNNSGDRGSRGGPVQNNGDRGSRGGPVKGGPVNGGSGQGGNDLNKGRGGSNDQRGGPVQSGGGTRGEDWNKGRGANGGWNNGSQIGGTVSTSGQGRVDRVQIGRVDESLLTKKPNSRSGRVSYQGNSNIQNQARVDRPILIEKAPVVRNGSIQGLIDRRERVQLNVGGVRINYYHYDSRWRDDYFWYPYYAFSPYGSQVCVSPWYYYPCLPAYVNWSRCRFYSFDPWGVNWYGTSYRWNRPSYDSYGYGYNSGYGNYQRGTYSDLDYAIDDIVNSFERLDRRAIGRLIPDRGDVAIYVDGNYSYSLNGDDFYDMFADAIENTRTRRYVVTNVQTNRDSARVTARHDYEDPWGRSTNVWHYYELKQDRRGMTITRFGVSGNDGW